MAATEENLFPLAERTHFNATIGHGSIPNQIEASTKSAVVNSSISEVSISQNGVLQSINTSSTENSTSGIDVIQVSSTQVGLNQITPMQVGGIQTSIPDNSAFQIGFYQDSTSQIGSSQIGSAQINSVQIKPSQVNQFSGGSSFGLEQLNSWKVPLSISIPKPQLIRSNFPSHNLTSNFLSNLKYSGTEFWKDILKPETAFNINFQVEDLPSGQLAEAQITEYDSFGRPSGGTILIDSDANGKGWFIDSTPFDNNEFNIALSDTAYSASADSAAFGRYDLLTALLHEMGHLAGFISGYSEFDRHIQTVNGSSLFITPDGISAAIVGDHLDPKLYPYDLLSPVLTPGVCTLPSLVDAQLIAATSLSNGGWSQKNVAALSTPLTRMSMG